MAAFVRMGTNTTPFLLQVLFAAKDSAVKRVMIRATQRLPWIHLTSAECRNFGTEERR